MKFDELLYEELKKHIGHNVKIVAHGDPNDSPDICLQCEDCNKSLLEVYISKDE